MYVCMYAFMYVCMYVCMYVYILGNVCMYVCVNACTYVCMYIVHTHLRTYVCMHVSTSCEKTYKKIPKNFNPPKRKTTPNKDTVMHNCKRKKTKIPDRQILSFPYLI